MSPRDLKIAGIITAACLMLSFAASYSYVRGWYWTSGVLPLALTVILVLIVTVILEFLGGPTKVAFTPPSDEAKQSPPRKRREALFVILLRRGEKPLSPLLWLMLITIERLASMSHKARRDWNHEMLGPPWPKQPHHPP